MFLCPDNSFCKRKCTLHFSTEKMKSDFQLPLQHWKKFLLHGNQTYWPKGIYAFDLRYQICIGIIPSEINHAPTLKPALVSVSTGGKSGPGDQERGVQKHWWGIWCVYTTNWLNSPVPLMASLPWWWSLSCRHWGLARCWHTFSSARSASRWGCAPGTRLRTHLENTRAKRRSHLSLLGFL